MEKILLYICRNCEMETIQWESEIGIAKRKGFNLRWNRKNFKWRQLNRYWKPESNATDDLIDIENRNRAINGHGHTGCRNRKVDTNQSTSICKSESLNVDDFIISKSQNKWRRIRA